MPVFSLIMRAEPSHRAMPTEPGWNEYQLFDQTLLQLRKQTADFRDRGAEAHGPQQICQPLAFTGMAYRVKFKFHV